MTALADWLTHIYAIRSGPEIEMGLERIRPIFDRMAACAELPCDSRRRHEWEGVGVRLPLCYPKRGRVSSGEVYVTAHSSLQRAHRRKRG